MTEEQRDEVARILEMIAAEGLPHPRNLDAALDAIADTMAFPEIIYVPGHDHSLNVAKLRRQKICVSKYGRGFAYEYAGDDYVEDGFKVVEAWVAD